MRKKSFNRGMGKLMNRGYSKQSAFNTMKGLSKKSRNKSKYIDIPIHSWMRYLFALIIELVLLFYKVPSKEDVQITLIQTLIPLSDATKPLAGFISIIAIVMQIVSLLLIYDLLVKLYYTIKKKII